VAVDVRRPEALAESLVDRVRYPISDLSCERSQEVVMDARRQLATRGAAELPGFLSTEGLADLVVDAERLTGRAHKSEGAGTAYLAAPDTSLPERHPTRWRGPYRVGTVAYDLIPRDSPLRCLYEWAPMIEFVEAIVDRGSVFPYADPFGALNLAVMDEGDQLQWHFDQVDFVVSLAIRPSESGGQFEVVPFVRDGDDERYADVAEVLAGDMARVQVLAMTPGTLLFFEGRNSLHRVSPVAGSVSRLVGLLGYDTSEGTLSSDLLRQSRYGRTTPYSEPPPL
jgi:hypothetical protein